ncbi:hypothetical protein ABTX71_12875 [Streptomyces parvulus]|uniref:hypothetical protein n=1 Tax=Streptomyces parvulus TaxID=146923 RepID=UPI0033247686
MTRRCTRGHFIPATADTSTCHCTLTRRPKRRRWLDLDLWGQGLTALQRHSIRTVPVVGRYL